MTTLERIRSEAATLFAERGFAGTSMARIANAVGIRKPSLYNYYSSKEELLQKLVVESMEAWNRECERHLEGTEDPRQQLHDYFHSIFAFADSNPQSVALVRIASTQIGGRLGERFREPVLSEQNQMVSDVERLCAAAMERAHLADSDPRELALFWTAVVDGILINKLFATPRASEFGPRLEELWQRLWQAMGGRT